ncbi:MAG TPA: hypothetical protein VII92_08495, partial [Anaerolineae bacterium]
NNWRSFTVDRMKAILIPDRAPIHVQPRELRYLVERAYRLFKVERYPRVTQGRRLLKVRFGWAGDDCSIGVGMSGKSSMPIGIFIRHTQYPPIELCFKDWIGPNLFNIGPKYLQILCVPTSD